MAVYSRRVVTTTTVEYFVPSPTNWNEVRKAFAAVENEIGPEAASWDTAAWVESRDDEVVIWFEKSKEVGH